jgi:hypothetical protein
MFTGLLTLHGNLLNAYYVQHPTPFNWFQLRYKIILFCIENATKHVIIRYVLTTDIKQAACL